MLIRAKINCINVTAARDRLIHREVLQFPVSGIAQICRNATLPFDEFLEMGSRILFYGINYWQCVLIGIFKLMNDRE